VTAARELLVVVGARPNFVKVAPVLAALRERDDVRVRVLHTGQHYDRRMSGSFLDQLGFPEPRFHLGVGSGSHGEQTAAVLVGVERVLSAEAFDAVLVAGDVNSTLAAALAAAKAGVAVIHLEAGLRSGDWTMPEEINRVLTDRLAGLLLTHSDEAIGNLAAEGIDGGRVALVGNTMIDSLLALLPAARATGALAGHGLQPRGYVLVTLHRPALVDEPARLAAVVDVLAEIAGALPVVFPMHPRTRARLGERGAPGLERIRVLPPLEYLEFVDLEARARLVVTDSGGVQEEKTALGVPCLTYRTTTERPVTIRDGTNELVGLDPQRLRQRCAAVLGEPWEPRACSIPLWDGRAGARAAAAVAAFLTRPPAEAPLTPPRPRPGGS
jgi:UDP-N-acetylglucosamine 2-epimerase (non-hydrolysing)